MAKSAERVNPKAVQQRAKQLPQSGRRDLRSKAVEKGSERFADVIFCDLSGVGSVLGRRRGDLQQEIPSRAHRITAPLWSELEMPKGLWVTEKS